jgi:glucan phosphoethanolaminetransferase (alkaline phosphatase superfamily)
LPFLNIIVSLFNNHDFQAAHIMIITFIVAWIIFVILWKLVKTTIKTAVTCAAIVVLLYFGFGITPQDILQKISEITQNISQTPVRN